MKEVLVAITDRLTAEIPSLKYVDENWGQIDEYRQQSPGKFPMALVDVDEPDWSDLGNRVQTGDLQISVRIAALRLSNSSKGAPATQKAAAFAIFDLLDAVHRTLHGWAPTDTCSRMVRTATTKVSMSAGVKIWDVKFKVRWTDTGAVDVKWVPVQAGLNLEVRN